MNSLRKAAICILFIAMGSTFYPVAFGQQNPDINNNDWTSTFNLDNCHFAPFGRNDYFILEPGYYLRLHGIDEDSVVLEITVLDNTIEIGDITAAVVEEQESENGRLVEISKNYYAICRSTGSIYYFGEDVDIYKNGKITSHDGSWRAFENRNKPGLMMPGSALPGARYYQEIAPETAMDRAEIVSVSEKVNTEKTSFSNCLKILETTPLEPEAREFKYYAPGIGLIQDADLKLIDYGYVRK